MLIVPVLVKLPVWPPRISTPVEPSTSLIEIVPALVTLLLLSRVTAVGLPEAVAPEPMVRLSG